MHFNGYSLPQESSSFLMATFLQAVVKKELGRGREEREGTEPVKFDRRSDDSRRGDPAWMIAGAEDFGDETPLLEQRRQEFEAERKAMQVMYIFSQGYHTVWSYMKDSTFLSLKAQLPRKAIREFLIETLQGCNILLDCSLKNLYE